MKKHQNFKPEALIMAVMITVIAFTILFFKTDSETNASNIKYINEFGWSVEETPTDIQHLTIPDSTDRVFAAYADKLNNQSLFNLCGKRVCRYSYKVLNHSDSDCGMIRINLIVYDGEIVASDISSLSENGFILPINDTSNIT